MQVLDVKVGLEVVKNDFFREIQSQFHGQAFLGLEGTHIKLDLPEVFLNLGLLNKQAAQKTNLNYRNGFDKRLIEGLFVECHQ